MLFQIFQVSPKTKPGNILSNANEIKLGSCDLPGTTMTAINIK